MIQRLRLIWVFLFLGSSQLYADGLRDTTIYLNQVNINSNIIQNLSSGNKIQRISPKTIEAYRSSSLLNILSDNSMLNIKSYGISGISNISIRGSQTNQTAVLWNGVNLQDPLNGSVNPALFPVGLVDEIQIQYGGSGALFGSGAVGGAIMMKKNLAFNTGWNGAVGLGVGSFSNYKGELKIAYGGQKYSGSLLYYHSQGENDFPYQNTQAFGHPEVKQENASSRTDGFSQDNSFILTKNQKINTHLWYQKSHRQIASNMTIGGANNFQDDESLRFTSNWIKYGDMISFMSRFALLHSQLDYHDPNSLLEAKHQSSSVIAQFESNIQMSKSQLLNWGIKDRFDIAKSHNYPDNSHRNTLALFLSYRLQLKKLNLIGSIRSELVDNELTPLTPAFGLDYFLSKSIGIKAKISRNYRMPTFNDLFWKGGFAHGNPDLKAESGWSEEISMEWQDKFGIYSPSIKATAFNSITQDLIVWVPDDNIWHPVNKKKVWSRGIELEQANTLKTGKFENGLNFYYTFNPSTLESGINSGKQLIYQPIYQAKVKYYLNYKEWSFHIIYQYFGERYITEDNSKYLNAYQVFGLGLFGHFSIGEQSLSISFHLNNLFNEVYQSVENYATPLRNFQLSLQYKI